mgnify:CR=1 FL=1
MSAHPRTLAPRNFGVVVPGMLYRSASPLTMGMEARERFARRLGLRTVVNVAEEEPDSTWPLGVLTLHLPGEKQMTQPAWEVWKGILLLKKRWPMLVHCHAGVERTGSYIAHAMVFLGLSLEDAIRSTIEHGSWEHGFLWTVPELRILRASLQRLEIDGDVLALDEMLAVSVRGRERARAARMREQA